MQKEFLSGFAACCGQLSGLTPLIHCITNPVAMNFNANVLLAVGASPLMSSRRDESLELASLSSALYVNIGCPDETLVAAAKESVAAFSELGKPWVLDPVGAGAVRLRRDIAIELMSVCPPAVVRGNPSEIMALNGDGFGAKGVDSQAYSDAALDSARSLATRFKCVVAVSGAVDYITDGSVTLTIGNGSPVMQTVSGVGCSESALCAAFAAVDSNPLRAAWCGVALMGLAGERAAAVSSGPGSFQMALLDELASFNPAEYSGKIITGLI